MTQQIEALDRALPTAGRRKSLSSRLLSNPLGLAASAYIAAIILVALIGPLIAPYDPNAASLQLVFAPQSPEHLLGADSAGRDVLSRLIHATSVSLAGAAVAVVVAAAIGIPSGLIAGYRGGWFDTLSAWLSGVILSLPAIVVLLAVRAVVGPSLWVVMGIFGVILAPSYYRVVFNAVRGVRGELYIDAAKVSGLTDSRIIRRHVLTAVRAPAILLTAGLLGVSIAIQAALDFLGLGDPALPSWGGMLSEGFYNIFRGPMLILWPSLAISLTCIAFTLLGSALRDELELTGDRTEDRRLVWSPPRPRPAPPINHENSSPEEKALLDVDSLSVSYQVDGGWKTVVDGVSLRIAPGEVHALVGESGSGKTQTAWSILGLLPEGGRIMAGTIRMEGTELTSARPQVLARIRGRHIGYVPQEPLSNLDPSYTIGHQLCEPLRVLLNMDRKAARETVMRLLERVGINDPQRVYSSYPHQISGGMAQRVLIAGAVSCKPALIVADEPTTALDVTVQAEILDLLRTLQREEGLAMLLVTHNFGVVADLADRVSVMRSGSIIETGSVETLFNNPEHDYTKKLFAALLDDAPARPAWTNHEVMA
ncbi:dipeptide/oligopeptide/nickel ABC transporter permease/ATP-binding protein [Arthrobacter sp. StoSoilB20]|uniref:dipeptide/oligopeptide/nickel ABC transporter permease/ATP-binding protein n=1 Tax=Arthrobacter sp. StoSoilB20 TaxID=2830995 RepID=UPI001CC79B11|nr:dipeptide/oligopeptide/nickel ABC transporter permease/ATP-binding protein [Arthrobacter sp. StoSoilB20]BCW58644.1 dipeptide/oligopeptide/nickel ABC transporter ATP-binding protein [Arthrobacter sp. StoSoilB20]